MTPEKFQAAIEKLGLSQVKAARLFGYNERTTRRWASGEDPVPRIIEIVLWLMIKFKVRPTDLPEE